MKNHYLPYPAILLALALPAEALAQVDYARDVRPILQKNCARCHGPKKQEGGLRLDVRRRALAGGDSGPALVPGNVVTGEILRRVTTRDDKIQMPPDQPLAERDIVTLREWIRQGAPWPDALAGREPAEEHWAFRPVARPALPEVRDAGAEVRNGLDRLHRARLRDRGLSPSPPAGRATLLRRLHLDLVGLPPTPEEARRFLADDAPDAYERLVERLLASPHFGERWGRHWLDLARFAESDGYENDRLRPDAWRFRDWVIRAVNDDLPYDQFTVAQLAGDLLPNATLDHRVAAGFHRHTLWNSAASADKEEFRTLAVKDRTDTTGLVWMGLTLGCAQCHSHKYDPIAHREYYRLYAFFNRTDSADVKLGGGKAAVATLREVERPTRVHLRGNFLTPGPEVSPGVPAFLPPLHARGATPDRLDLARWLVDPRHPLTARVAVNHLWQHLFGVGLVPTPENFGLNGTPPRHPEILDWLAAELVRHNWSRKALIRTIVLSAAYRQSSRKPAEDPDPGNEWFARQNRYRVEAEVVRDLALAVGGLLSTRVGGPSVVPPFPEGLLEQKFTNEALKLPGPDRHRRGVYVHVQRTLQHPTLAVFEAADGNAPCPRRDRSVTPLQALTLLNNPVFVEAARAFGKRLQTAPGSEEERLRFGFTACLTRAPTERELAVLRELVRVQRQLGASDEALWFGVARTLLNLEGTTTRE